MAKHILSCSFGKDSIATALLALQHGEPLDELVYCEVMFNEEISGELPEHNRFIHETAIPYFEQRGIPTRVLRSEKTYLSCFYHVVTRGKTKGMDKAIKELERLSPVNIIFQNEGVVGYDAEQHAIVFPTAMPQREVLARLPAEIVIATAEQHTPGISQAPYLRKTAMAVSVEFCGRFSLPMPDTAAATLDGMDTHIPPGEERKTLEEIRELSVTIGDTVEKALGLQRGQSSPQRDEAR